MILFIQGQFISLNIAFKRITIMQPCISSRIGCIANIVTQKSSISIPHRNSTRQETALRHPQFTRSIDIYRRNRKHTLFFKFTSSRTSPLFPNRIQQFSFFRILFHLHILSNICHIQIAEAIKCYIYRLAWFFLQRNRRVLFPINVINIQLSIIKIIQAILSYLKSSNILHLFPKF